MKAEKEPLNIVVSAASAADSTERSLESAEISRRRGNNLRRLLRQLKPYRGSFTLALGCMVLFGASDGIIPFLVKHILDGVFKDKDQGLLLLIPLLVVLFAVVRAVVDFGQQFLMSRIGHQIVRDFRNAVNQRLLSLAPDYFLANTTGNILARFTSDVVLLRETLTNSLAAVIRDSIRIVALLIAAIYLDPVLALIAFLVFPIGLIPIYQFGRRMRRLSKRGQDAIGTLSSLLQETVVGHKVVRIFGREAYEAQRFHAENEKLNNTFVKAEKVRAATGPINEVLAAFAIAAIILYGGYSVIGGLRSQGEFIAFLLAVFLLYDPFKRLSRVNNAVQQGLAGADRIYELLDTEPAIKDPAAPEPLGPTNSLSFAAVSFRYPGATEAALHDINLEVAEGERVALVGFSGAGKSTLVDLVPRFMDPQQGVVRVAGGDIARYRLQELRSRIAMVGQHTFLFRDTIYNNIAYGKAAATETEVVAVARAAFAYDFIQQLPQGFQTVVAESGLTLSGGERQRIAIARALLKDAPILILDEATASLDNQSEREVQNALDRLQRNRTTLVIAHRLSTIRNVQRIVVLDQGRIVEVGSHEELLALNGHYARLYALQFSPQAEADV